MRSPGHQKWPNHKVDEVRIDHGVRVAVNGEVLADSNDVLRVDEDDHPPRYYFPRSDVAMEKLERSETTSTCPFKGTAHYYSVTVGGERLADAVWTYEDPYEEHEALKERVAFYDERIPELEISLTRAV